MDTLFPFPAKTWSKTLSHHDQPVLNISVQQPDFPDSKKAARIQRYFNHVIQLWITRWREQLYPAQCDILDQASEHGSTFHPLHVELNHIVTYWNDPIFSVRLDVTESRPGTRPQLFCMGETWDLSTGYPLPLRSFFPKKSGNWRKIILASLKNQADQQIKSGESLLDPDCCQIIERTFDPNRYYLTNKGIAIFFPLYFLGPYAEGIPVFVIPFPNQTLIQTDSEPHP